jgi:hypothetical protein
MARCPCMVRLEALCGHPGPGRLLRVRRERCPAERESVGGLGPGLAAW